MQVRLRHFLDVHDYVWQNPIGLVPSASCCFRSNPTVKWIAGIGLLLGPILSKMLYLA